MTNTDSEHNTRRRPAALADEQTAKQMPLVRKKCKSRFCNNFAAPGSDYCDTCQTTPSFSPDRDPLPGGTGVPDDVDDLIPGPEPELPRTKEQKLDEVLERLRRVEEKLDELLEEGESE